MYIKTLRVFGLTTHYLSINIQGNKICPRCQSSLDKCGEHDHKGHGHHRICKTCHWCNF